MPARAASAVRQCSSGVKEIEMPRIDVQIPTGDGVAKGSLHVPDGEGPWPGVVMFPDAFGL